MEIFQELLDVARQSTVTAGDYLLKGFRSNPELSNSTTDDSRSGIFTVFDKGSNNILMNTLIEGFLKQVTDSNLFICSEESGFSIVEKLPNSTWKTKHISEIGADNQNSYLWVIDPVCGTIPFARGVADFIVSVALMKGNDIILGVVYDPVQKEQFYALKGRGAFLNNKPIGPSEVKSLREAYVSIEHGVFRVAPCDDLQKISKIIRRLRVAGTCGLELSYVACGRIDALVKLKQPLYDYSAGSLILSESLKGRNGLTKLDGYTTIDTTVSMLKDTSFIASNGLIHDEIANITRSWVQTIR